MTQFTLHSPDSDYCLTSSSDFFYSLEEKTLLLSSSQKYNTLTTYTSFSNFAVKIGLLPLRGEVIVMSPLCPDNNSILLPYMNMP